MCIEWGVSWGAFWQCAAHRHISDLSFVDLAVLIGAMFLAVRFALSILRPVTMLIGEAIATGIGALFTPVQHRQPGPTRNELLAGLGIALAIPGFFGAVALLSYIVGYSR